MNIRGNSYTWQEFRSYGTQAYVNSRPLAILQHHEKSRPSLYAGFGVHSLERLSGSDCGRHGSCLHFFLSCQLIREFCSYRADLRVTPKLQWADYHIKYLLSRLEIPFYIDLYRLLLPWFSLQEPLGIVNNTLSTRTEFPICKLAWYSGASVTKEGQKPNLTARTSGKSLEISGTDLLVFRWARSKWSVVYSIKTRLWAFPSLRVAHVPQFMRNTDSKPIFAHPPPRKIHFLEEIVAKLWGEFCIGGESIPYKLGDYTLTIIIDCQRIITKNKTTLS